MKQRGVQGNQAWGAHMVGSKEGVCGCVGVWVGGWGWGGGRRRSKQVEVRRARPLSGDRALYACHANSAKGPGAQRSCARVGLVSLPTAGTWGRLSSSAHRAGAGAAAPSPSLLLLPLSSSLTALEMGGEGVAVPSSSRSACSTSSGG